MSCAEDTSARRRALPTAIAALAVAVLTLLAPSPASAGDALRAGVGRADITPQTGYPLGGFVRADRTGDGQHTRLFATALVLQRGARRVALLSLDLFAAPGGLVKHAANRAGFSERDVLVSASHTHGGPSKFANFETYNTIAPAVGTFGDPSSFTDFLMPAPPDPALYAFLVRQISEAIRRARRDMEPAVAAWGASRLVGVTRNRSIEAHLANHGILRDRRAGSAALDPAGVEHTVVPQIDVLRVDKRVTRCVRTGGTPTPGPTPAPRPPGAFTGGGCPAGSRPGTVRIPLGGWSTFANHGTVNPSTFEVYHQDHHGAATRVFEAGVRSAGRVPASQAVVNVYGNSDAGDQSAGLDVVGPAHAEDVGRREARAMLAAWRSAGGRLSARPALGLGWTRVCFCGQRTARGTVASSPAIGLPFLTGSEEERGPLFDLTGVPFEDRRLPVALGEQGHKLGIPGFPTADSVPRAVPLTALRLGDRMVVTFPGEPTAGVGQGVRAAVGQATASRGIRRIVFSGYTNEYLNYFTTPEEYARQHYEGGSTLFGPFASTLLTEQLVELAGRLVRGEAPQPAFPLDPTNGVSVTNASFGAGATSSAIAAQPRATVQRLGEAVVAWRGAARGLDRPVDAAFVRVERRVGRTWRGVTTDLGLQIIWRVDEQGRYTASWEVPLDQALGTYRIRITARGYTLVSRAFAVRPLRALSVTPASAGSGRVGVSVGNPAARPLEDITYRPARIGGGSVEFRRAGDADPQVVRSTGSTFTVQAPSGARVTIPAGGARDRFGNTSGAPVVLTAP